MKSAQCQYTSKVPYPLLVAVTLTYIHLLNISIYGLRFECRVIYFYLYEQNEIPMLQSAFPPPSLSPSLPSPSEILCSVTMQRYRNFKVSMMS